MELKNLLTAISPFSNPNTALPQETLTYTGQKGDLRVVFVEGTE